MARRIGMPASTRRELLAWYDAALLDETPLIHGSLSGRAFGLFRQAAVTVNGMVHLTSKAPEDLESVET